MNYVSVSVDVDIDDIFDNMTNADTRELVRDLIDSGYGPGGYKSEAAFQDMEDAKVRLDAISWLRGNGWKVEPE